MPLREMPQFKSVPDKMMELPQPGIGGLNLKDLEFEQEVTQSPYMLNMMYRNGAFGKRYGQEIHSTFSGNIYDMTSYNGEIFVHAGTHIYKYNENGSHTSVIDELPETKGMFITFSQKLYYMISSGFYEYNGTNFVSITPYVPEVLINCEPDGSYGGDSVDEPNVMGNKIQIVYNGRNGVTTYDVGTYDDILSKIIKWSVTPVIEVDDEETSAFSVNTSTRKITFTTAPQEGNMNVRMTFTIKDDVFADRRAEILNCKYYDTFGGSNNSRLFVAGSGGSKYFWSEAYDISYFPELNIATLGNTEEDITGFGRQYNVLIVFKPREVYSIYSYTQTSSTTIDEDQIGYEGFRSQLVNARVGCDAPHSIQLINNLLTWYNSHEGICTLVSTNIQDERNVRLLSRNIDYTNGFGITGILDFDEDPINIQSADFDNKYFLCFPTSGHCFIWDYEISPYHYSASGETNPRQLDWFLFDHFYALQFLKFEKKLLFASSHSLFRNNIILLNDTLADLDFDEDGRPDPIEAFYMTPFLQFGAVAYLKTIKNMYIQSRGDTATMMEIYYYTEESGEPEEETEHINVGGKIWNRFAWNGYNWSMMFWGITYRIRCMLKKVQMASFFFRDNNLGRDLSLTHIALQYQVIKNIK